MADSFEHGNKFSSYEKWEILWLKDFAPLSCKLVHIPATIWNPDTIYMSLTLVVSIAFWTQVAILTSGVNSK